VPDTLLVFLLLGIYLFMYFYSQVLQDRSEARKAKVGGKGSGRLSNPEQKKENALHAALVLLKKGILPDDPKTVVPPPRSSSSLLTSAASHLQFHASQINVPRGHVKITANQDLSDDDDDDDDVEDTSFGSYYQITPHQKAFNLSAIQKHIGKNPSANNMQGSTEFLR
jgi:hypothetical protein